MAIMHLYLLLLSQLAATPVLDRYVAFRKGGEFLSADFQVNAKGHPLKATTAIEGGKRLYVHYSAQGVDYVLSMTPERLIELDHVDKVYDEDSGRPEISFRKSHLFYELGSYPIWLLDNDFRKSAPKGSAFQLTGDETLDGQKCDIVRSQFNVEGQKGMVEASIDGKGRIHRANINIVTAMGRYAYEWFVPRMTVAAKAPTNAFRAEVPDGYVPYKLPWKEGPLQAGGKFPLTGWVGAHGKPFDLKGKLNGKGAILVFLGEDQELNSRLTPALADLRKVSPLLTVSTTDQTIKSTDVHDPTGKLLKQIAVPGTPLFLHLDQAGVVRHLWMGYDPEKEEAFLTEVRNALGGKE